MTSMSRLEKKLLGCFESRDFYEAHQIYRTLFYRMSTQGKWQPLQDLLYNGAIKLIDVDEPTSAIDIAELFVESLEKANSPVSSATLDRFEQLFTRLPASLEKKSTPDGNRTDRRNEFLSRALKWTMTVGNKKRIKEKGHPDLHARVAKILWQEGNYAAARNHFVLSDDAERFASFLIDFNKSCGFNSEKDLFIAQAVLQVLCTRRSKMAQTLLQLYCEKHPEIKAEAPYELPLLNFMWLLTLCVQLRKVTYFSILVEQYQKCLERDPSYKEYLDKIGQLYFGLPPPQKQTPGGIFGSLIKGLMGSAATASSAQNGDTEDSEDEDLMDEGSIDEDRYMSASNLAQQATPVETVPKTEPKINQTPQSSKVPAGVIEDVMDLD